MPICGGSAVLDVPGINGCPCPSTSYCPGARAIRNYIYALCGMNTKCVSRFRLMPVSVSQLPTPRVANCSFSHKSTEHIIQIRTPAATFAPFATLSVPQTGPNCEKIMQIQAAGFTNMLICILRPHCLPNWPPKEPSSERKALLCRAQAPPRPSYALERVILPVFFTPTPSRTA